MSDRLSSAFWKRFAIDPNNDLRAICNLCNDSVSRETTKSITTTNMREHLNKIKLIPNNHYLPLS